MGYFCIKVCGIIQGMKHVDFLSLFLDNAARARLLRIFLFNQIEPHTLNTIVRRAGVTRATVVREIKLLESIKLIKGTIITVKFPDTKRKSKKERAWLLNPQFEYIHAITNFVQDVSPAQFDLVASTLKKTGKVSTIILSGSFLNDPARPVDVLMAVDDLQKRVLDKALRSLEQLFGREIRYAAFPVSEFRYRMTIQDRLLRDTLDFPHTILMDKSSLL
jgi:hypothetical protein